jgi:hypothetical protein
VIRPLAIGQSAMTGISHILKQLANLLKGLGVNHLLAQRGMSRLTGSRKGMPRVVRRVVSQTFPKIIGLPQVCGLLLLLLLLLLRGYGASLLLARRGMSRITSSRTGLPQM